MMQSDLVERGCRDAALSLHSCCDTEEQLHSTLHDYVCAGIQLQLASHCELGLLCYFLTCAAVCNNTQKINWVWNIR